MSGPRFRPVSSERLELGEGVAWYDDRFLLVDLLAGRLLSFEPDHSSMSEVLRLDVPVGAAAPTTDGGLVIAAGDGVALVRDGSLDWLGRPEAGARTAMRMNDGITDPRGAFWATSMAFDNSPGAGSLYRVGPEGHVVKMLDGLTVPNGPAFAADGRRMYLADSARGVILAFRVDPMTGSVSDRQVFATVEDGSPDGMVVDADDHLWSAIWGAGCLHRYAPDGQLVAVVELPALQPTKVGISDSTSPTLVVTTATYGLSTLGDMDGLVLRSEAGVSGVRAAPFRGPPGGEIGA